jgi:soluble lytic murein transglycosylase-like protein
MLKCTIPLLIMLIVSANAIANSTIPKHTIPPQVPFWKVSRYEALATKTAILYGIKPKTAINLIWEESSNRQYIEHPVSGARGITQITKITAIHFGIDYESLFDPNIAIPAGIMILADYIKQCGGKEDWGLMAYNAGPSVCRYADSILNDGR